MSKYDVSKVLVGGRVDHRTHKDVWTVKII
jgi:hypothetical protein